MEERFEVLKDGMDRMSDKQDGFDEKLTKIVDALGSGSVAFTAQEGRLKALEREATRCADDRGKLHERVNGLEAGRNRLIGAVLLAQFVIPLLVHWILNAKSPAGH